MKWKIDFLQSFCDVYDIPIDIYDEISKTLIVDEHDRPCPPMRYFARNPFAANDCVLWEMSTKELKMKAITWMNEFYSIPGCIKVSQTDLYRNGQIMCMDISSALAVEAMELDVGHHVLDICCAPGSKLSLIASKVALLERPRSPESGTVTGVDISKHRLNTCRSVMKRNQIPNARLFLADGKTFKVGPPACYSDGVKFTNETKPFHAPKLLRQSYNDKELYDRVIVDAECTHDGSIVHLIKYGTFFSQDEFCSRVMNDRVELLAELQLQLLINGFTMLKKGGIIVYSTCSLSRKQNQDIINRFLQHNSDAYLMNINLPLNEEDTRKFINTIDDTSNAGNDVWDKTRQFYGTFVRDRDDQEWWISGFFLAKIKKM